MFHERILASFAQYFSQERQNGSIIVAVQLFMLNGQSLQLDAFLSIISKTNLFEHLKKNISDNLISIFNSKSYIDITIMAIDKEHPATNIIIHEDYQTSAIKNDNDNDISMIEVDMFGDPITLINYKTLNEVEEGTELQLFGFGRLNVTRIFLNVNLHHF